MIDLLKIKLNNEYDFVQNTVPTETGTWLCSGIVTGFTVGHSYNVVVATTTTVSRIEAVEDTKIQNQIYDTVENVCSFLNNFFYVRRQTSDITQYNNKYLALSIEESKDFSYYLSAYGNYTFLDGVVTGVQNQVFQIGDLVQLKCSLRNNYVSYVTNVSGNQITLGNDDMRNTTEDCLIMLMDIPKNVQNIIAQMVHYDVFIRENVDILQSETVGNHSYSKATAKVGELYYPPEIVSGLNNGLKIVRFI